MQGTHAAARQRGHIDLRPVILIVLVLAAVAFATAYGERTGQHPLELLRELSPLARGFLAALGLAVVGAVLTGVIAARHMLEGDPFTIREQRGAAAVLGRRAGTLAAGCYLLASGAVFAGFGAAGSGLAWGALLAAGTAALLTGAALCGLRRAWVAEAHALRIERRWFGMPRVLLRVAWDAGAPPVFTVDTQRSGGVFGQPLSERHRVTHGAQVLFESADENEAQLFADALRRLFAPPPVQH